MQRAGPSGRNVLNVWKGPNLVGLKTASRFERGSLPDFKGWAQTGKTAVLKEQRTEKEGAADLYIHILERK